MKVRQAVLKYLVSSGGAIGLILLAASSAFASSGPAAASAPSATNGDVTLTTVVPVYAGHPTAPNNGVTVANFTDTNNDPNGNFTATINWGDGLGPVAATVNGTTCSTLTPCSVTGNPPYSGSGRYTLTVRVVDTDGADVSAQTVAFFGVVVTGCPHGPDPLNSESNCAAPAFTEGASATRQVAYITDGDLAQPPTSSFQTTIDWGDGTAPTVQNGGAGLTRRNYGWTLTGTHTYADETSITGAPSVSATESVDNQSGAGPFGPTIADAPLTAGSTPSFSGTESYTIPGGSTLFTFTDGNPNASCADYTSGGGSIVVTWGDGSTSTLPGASDIACSQSGSTFSVTTTGHTYPDEGSFTLTVTVTDAGGSTTNNGGQSVNVADGALTDNGSTAFTGAAEGGSFSGTVASFHDANTDQAGNHCADYTITINWGDGSSSAGTCVFDGSGNYHVTGTHTYAEGGTYNYSVTITDDGGSTVTISKTSTVTDYPIYNLRAGDGTHSGNFTAVEGSSSGTQVLASFHDQDPGSVCADFTQPSSAPGGASSITVNWGDGSSQTAGCATSANPRIVKLVGNNYQIEGAHTYTEEAAYTVSITVSDHGALCYSNAGATQIANCTVTETATVSDAAITVTHQDFSAVEGQGATYTVATLTDANPAATCADFTVTINWGDGSSGAGACSGTGPFTIRGTHTYAEEGSYTVSVSARDDGGSSSSDSGTATVSDQQLTNVVGGRTLSGNEGSSVSGVVATFTDPAGAEPVTGSNYLATINWGDGTSSAGTIANTGGNNFSVSGTHTYAEEGTYTVAVTITHEALPSITVNSTANIADVSVSVTGVNVSAVEGASTGSVQVATFTDPGTPAGEPAANYSASINWGDGTAASTGTISFGGGVFTVSGSHTYAEEGTYAITITINHEMTTPQTATDTATVSNPAVVATGGFPFTAVEGALSNSQTVATFTDPGGPEATNDYTTSINWGDGTAASAGTITGPTSGSYSVTGTHTYAEEGTYTVTTTVSHETAAPASGTSTATVADAALTTTSQGSQYNFSSAEGQPVGTQILGTFTDANPGATCSDFTGVGSITINWGDGASSAATCTQLANGSFQVSGNHTYADEGSYTVGWVATDDGGATTSGGGTTAAIADAAIGSTGTNISATAGTPFTGTVATFSDNNPQATCADYTITINWGDGTTSAGTCVQDANSNNQAQFHVTGTHTYAKSGTFTVAVNINDIGGVSSSTTSQASVAPNPTPTPTPTATPTPTPTPGVTLPNTSGDPRPLPWVWIGLLVVSALGGITALALRRGRQS